MIYLAFEYDHSFFKLGIHGSGLLGGLIGSCVLAKNNTENRTHKSPDVSKNTQLHADIVDVGLEPLEVCLHGC